MSYSLLHHRFFSSSAITLDGSLFFSFLDLHLFTPSFKNIKTFLSPFLLFVAIVLFSLTDLAYNPTRLKNLAFFNNAGFNLKIQELKTEGGIKYLYNPLFVGIRDIFLQQFTYLSPQFLLMNGDENYRFGFPGMSIFTPIEYIFVFIGIYFLFKNSERWRWFILSIIFISPLSASLAWSTGSLTRSLFLLIPLCILSAYGFINTARIFKHNQKKYFYLIIVLIFSFFTLFSWDFYLFHYPKRLITIHAWQCGYSEVGQFLKDNYNKYDTFYITRDIGMPYIFSLFYLRYPPEKYQQVAQLTAPDEYGFGQIEKFDKFIFDFKSPLVVGKRSVVIGSVDNFKGIKIDTSLLHTISVNGEPMFQIYQRD